MAHTGQHYDWQMSSVFFNELEIPEPDYNLEVGSASHGVQTAEMIKGIEECIQKERPQCVIVYGDTNSTLAAAVAASKLHCPIAHIEAGLRSYNKRMPEEINRILCDHASTLLFSPTETGLKNLLNEGFRYGNPPYTIDNPGIFQCGDVMLDNSLYFAAHAEKKSTLLNDNNLNPGNYCMVTIHRDNNTDIPSRLQGIFKAIITLSAQEKIDFIIPLHPRTSRVLESNLGPLYDEVKKNRYVKITGPASFFDMIVLEKNARLIMTDSGGVQKEAFFFKKPCVILRDETEWTELVSCGAALIAGADTDKIINSFYHLNNKEFTYPSIFGDGHTAEFICKAIIENL